MQTLNRFEPMAVINFQLKKETIGYGYHQRPLNCQAVAQMILQHRKQATEEPSLLEQRLDYMEILYSLDKAGLPVYLEKYGCEWVQEIKEANRRILEESGRIKPDLQFTTL